MKTEKLELGQGRKTLLNKCIVFKTEQSFIEMVNLLEKFNYDISHYEQTYKKAREYISGKNKSN